MRKNGFTLIELLAVIVILAIISLIAVPIVVNIIDDSKKSSNEESIKMYGKAIENAAGNYFLKHPNDKKVTIQKLKNENLINYDGTKVECVVEKIYQSGKIYLKNCTVGGTKVDYIYGEESYKDYINLVEDTGESGLSIGDKYTYDVNDTDTFTFYVLSIEGNQVNLIMNRNICGSTTDPNDSNNGKPATEENKCLIAWYSSNDDNSYGPITVMQGLYNATKDWDNVPNMNLSENMAYKDEGHVTNSSYGYGKIETTTYGIRITKKDGTDIVGQENEMSIIMYEKDKTLKARLAKAIEVTNAGCRFSASGSCFAWLVDNLAMYSTYYLDNEHISGINGFWLLSSRPGYSNCALFVLKDGQKNDFTGVSNNSYGIRPVITVPISDLSN